jgi:hypothetical protein
VLRGARCFAPADLPLEEFLVPLRRSHYRPAQLEVHVELSGAPEPMRKRLMRICEF